MDLLPGHPEVRTARRNDANLWIDVALPLVGPQVFGNGIVERRPIPLNALCSSEDRFYSTFVLIDGVDARDQYADDEPGRKAQDETNQNWHKAASILAPRGLVSYKHREVSGVVLQVVVVNSEK